MQNKRRAEKREFIEFLVEPFEKPQDLDCYLRREIARGIEQLNRGEFAEFTAESVIGEVYKNRGLTK